MATEGVVQVAPDSTGKKVRTVEVTTSQGTVEQQVATLADSAGNLLDTALSGVAQDGTDGNAISQPLGGAGIRGWLSGIYRAVSGTLTVAWTGQSVASTQSGTWTVQPGNTANTTAWKVDGSAVTQPVSGTVTASQGGAPWSDNLTQVGGVAVAATAKGTQGANFLPAQDAKDSGRTYLSLVIDRIAGVSSEALATMTINRGGSTSSASSYTVTAGKTLRLQMLSVSISDSTTTAINGRVRVRSAASVLVSSPIVIASDVGSFPGTAAAGMGVGEEISIPDGLEIAGGQQIAISQVLSATSSLLSVNLIGYEY